jgi:hypothetical protein
MPEIIDLRGCYFDTRNKFHYLLESTAATWTLRPYPKSRLPGKRRQLIQFHFQPVGNFITLSLTHTQ